MDAQGGKVAQLVEVLPCCISKQIFSLYLTVLNFRQDFNFVVQSMGPVSFLTDV